MNREKQFKSIPQNKIFNSSAGFTLVEVMVSIFILAVMSSLFLANYKSGRHRMEISITAQRVISDIRLAQNYTLGLVEYDDGSPPPETPAGGWGIHFDQRSSQDRNKYYIIFADVNQDQNYDKNSEFYKRVDLPENIIVDSITVDQINPRNQIDIIFEPPDPTTYIGGPNNTDTQITLRENYNNTTKTIEVNFLGLVDVGN